MVNEGPAHIVDFFDEVGVQVEWTTMVVDAVDPRVVGLAMSHAREYVHFMVFPFKGSGKFCDVNADPANGDGM
jgi:hypothetical protein